MFTTKLNLVNAAAKAAFRRGLYSAQRNEKWVNLKNRLDTLSTIRNYIAHYQIKNRLDFSEKKTRQSGEILPGDKFFLGAPHLPINPTDAQKSKYYHEGIFLQDLIEHIEKFYKIRDELRDFNSENTGL